MANISSAYGHIEITAKEPRKVAEAIDKILGPKRACYYTELDLNDIEEEKDGYLCTRFWGCGRWAFECNLNYFWDWCKNAKDGHKEDIDRKELAEAYEYLKSQDFELLFDFNDEEGGCQVLYEMIYWINHEAGKDAVYSGQRSVQEYEYSPENLVELGICESIDDAKEYCGYES